MTMRTMFAEPEWDSSRAFFAEWNCRHTATVSPEAPPEIIALLARMEQWDTDMNNAFNGFEQRSVLHKLTLASKLIGDGTRLRTDLDTKTVADWRIAPSTTPDDIAAVQQRRVDLGDRLESLALIGAASFRNAEFALPSQVGQRAWYRNAKTLSRLLGGRRLGPIDLGTGGVAIALVAIAGREHELVRSGIGRQLRTNTIFGRANRRRVDVVNQRNRRTAEGLTLVGRRLDYARAEHLRSTELALEEAGASNQRRDELIDRALQLGDTDSGKPWKGLIALRELVIYARHDPNTDSFDHELEQSMRGEIHYTYTPGREWVVRDFSIARSLLQADGKTSRQSNSVALSQAGASIVPGVLANHPALLGLAAHYMKPIQVYLNGVVAQSGSEHRRHRNVFAGFFRKGEVLEHSKFIESTVSSILDDVEAIARRNDGRFDFKTDLAFNFPIRIICDFMGIPPEMAAQVQHWAEASVRALDASAGLSLGLLTEGNRSAGAFLDYLDEMVTKAQNSEHVPGIIGEVSNTTELNRIELISNLAGITFAGFETTTGLLSLGFHELLQHPEQIDYLRQNLVAPVDPSAENPDPAATDRDLRWFIWAEDERNGKLKDDNRIERHRNIRARLDASPSLQARLDELRNQETVLGAAVEELLRWTAPGSVIPLTLEADFALESPIKTEVHGCPVASGEPIHFSKGQTITVDIASANRSGCPFGPGLFEQRHGDFDISRSNNTKHLSFGVTHICMGADLAIENAKRMIEGVLRRMPDLQLDGKADEQDGDLFIGLQSLPVRSQAFATPQSQRDLVNT